MLDNVRRDLVYTLRSLRRAPAFGATVVVILGLAIGMSSAMFTVFHAVLVQRFPVVDQDRVVELSGVAGGAASEVPIMPAQMQRLKKESRTLRSVAGLAHWRVLEEAFTDGDRRFTLGESVVTDDFFDVLGTKPALGRFFRKGESAPWGANTSGDGVAVVLSHSAWQRAFGGDSSVIGRALRSPKMGWSMHVVGVAPPGLDYPRGAEVWLSAEYGGMDVVARLAPGATPASAREELRAFMMNDPNTAQSFSSGLLGAQVHTLGEMVIGDVRPALFALSAAVALLLALACTNVGNLLLVRAADRVHEMAIRRAIGASMRDLAQQLITESAVLAILGGVVGMIIARVLLVALVQLAPKGLPRTDLITLAGTPFVVAALVTGVTLLLFGLAPSLGALRLDLSSPLRADARIGAEGRRIRVVRRALVGAQIALALVVLAGAGLLLRSLWHLASLDMGYSTEHLALLNVSFPWRQMSDDCKPKNGAPTAADSLAWSQCGAEVNYAAHERVMDKLRELSSVVSVSPEVVPPFLGSNVWMGRYAAQEESDDESKKNPWFGIDAVGPDYFAALGVPIVAGRTFTTADRNGSARVAIITEGVAKTLWPNQPAVGRRLRQGEDHTLDSMITVVGVVKDFHYRLHRESTPTIFMPYRQLMAQGYFVVRTRGDAQGQTLRRAVESAGGGATFVGVTPMDDLIDPQLAAPRFNALLLSIFALAALVLAAVGLYGVVASAVNQQTREIGIRMALGATSGVIRNMVLSQALSVTGIGAVVGLVGALVGARLLTSMLFDVKPTDPVTLGAVTVLLLAIAGAAAYVPARRATAIDPIRALRSD